MKRITGKQLQKARKVHGMTQEEAAKVLKITRGYLAQIEIGNKTPGPNLQKKIDRYFGSTVDQFLFTE